MTQDVKNNLIKFSHYAFNFFQDSFQVYNNVREIYSVACELCDNKSKSNLKITNLVSRLFSSLAALTSAGINIGCWCVGEKISETIKAFSIIPSIVSICSHIFKVGTEISIKRESESIRGKDILFSTVSIISEGAILAQRAIRIYKTSHPTFYHYANCIADGIRFSSIIYPIGRILSAFMQNRMNSHIEYYPGCSKEMEFQENRNVCCLNTENSLSNQLEKFSTDLDMSKHFLEKDLEVFFRRNGLEKFICPISKKIILHPLKHKDEELFFERQAVENQLQKNPHFELKLSDGRVLILKKKSFVPCPEVLTVIIPAIEFELGNVYERKAGKIIALSQKEIDKIFDLCNVEIIPESYWSIDPRKYILYYVQLIFEKSQKMQQKHFEGTTTLWTLLEKLRYIQTKTFPGLTTLVTIGSFFPVFTPLMNVKRILTNGSIKIIQLIENASKALREVA